MPQEDWIPVRSVRVPDDPWLPAKRKAEDHGETISEVINRLLRQYVRDYED